MKTFTVTAQNDGMALVDALSAAASLSRHKAKELLEEHKHNVYDVLSGDDPLAALGILYPLAVFLRHGKVNMELLTGEGGPGADDE